MKQSLSKKQGEEKFPPNQASRDDSVEVITDDRILTVANPYSMPSATSAVMNPPWTEPDATRQTANSLRGQGISRNKNALPPLFIYIEAGDFRRAMERAKRHPREVRTWASIKIKKSSDI